MVGKRRYNRYNLDAVEVNGKIAFASDINIIDLSLGGVALKANKRLNMGCEYDLKLEAKHKVMSLKALVVRSSLIETKKRPTGEYIPFYMVGMQFTNMTPELEEELLGFIEQNKKYEAPKPCGQRGSVRFQITPQENSTLHFLEHYRVKKIGLGGMLIECTNDMEIESKLPMRLAFPGNLPIYFVGRIASSQVIENGGRTLYAIGIEFMNLADNDRKVLTEFIDYCAAVEGRGNQKQSEGIAPSNESL